MSSLLSTKCLSKALPTRPKIGEIFMQNFNLKNMFLLHLFLFLYMNNSNLITSKRINSEPTIHICVHIHINKNIKRMVLITFHINFYLKSLQYTNEIKREIEL